MVNKKIKNRKKLYFFWFILFFGLYLSLELLVFVALSVAEGELFSLAKIQRLQDNHRADYVPYTLDKVRKGRRPSSLGQEVLHPYLGYVLNPNFVSGVSPLGFSSESDPLYKRHKDKIIIGIFGGSVAAYFYEAGKDTLTKELRRLPFFKNKEIIITGVAVAGFKQPQQLMALNYILALGGEFDIIINIDGYNEVSIYSENQSKNVFLAFPRNWYLRAQTFPEAKIQSTLGEIAHYKRRRRDWAKWFGRPPLRWSIMASLVWRIRATYLNDKITKGIEAYFKYQPQKANYQAIGPKQNFAKEQFLYKGLVDIWRQSSIQLNNLCKNNNIKYFHFLQPNQYVEGSKPMGKLEKEQAYREDHPYRPGVVKGYSLLIEQGKILKQSKVPFWDLTMIFSKVKEPIYIDTCCHMNKKGNIFMAQRISQIILNTYKKSKE